MSPIIVDRKEKKELIFDAARRAFSKSGFHRTTMGEIARLADIGKGTIYEYFPNKEELFFELCSYLFESFRDLYLKEISSVSLGVEEKIEKFISLSLSEIKKVENFFLVFLEAWLEISKKRGENSVVLRLRRIYDSYIKLLSSYIQEGIEGGKFKKEVNPRHLAAIILATIDGLATHWLSNPQVFSLDQIKKSLTKMILDSLRVAESVSH